MSLRQPCLAALSFLELFFLPNEGSGPDGLRREGARS